MNILVISGNYPSVNQPVYGTFIHETIKGLVNSGLHVLVVSPRVYFKNNKDPYEDVIDNVRIIYPRFFSFSNKTILFNWSTLNISIFSFQLSVKSTIKKIKDFAPDICYSHFLYPSGNAAYKISKILKIPYILSLGETTLHRHSQFRIEKSKKILKSSSRIIVVSNNLRNEVINKWEIPDDKVIHIPNGIDLEKFRKINQKNARKILKFPLNKKIIVFVGHFTNHKGPKRLLRAVQIADINAHLIFIGHGKEELKDKRIIFCGNVIHEKLPLYLNASDIFVMPTLGEGMSNAILEAMACGLPIVSSNVPSNKEFLDNSNSVLVDPLDVKALGQALKELLTDEEKLSSLSKSALHKIQEFSLQKRIERITDILNTL